MTLRPFSTDKPQRESITRQAIIHTRLDAANYLIDLGDGTPQMAFWGGNILLDPGTIVHAWWANEAFVHIIRGLAAGEGPLEPPSQQSALQTPADGSAA